MGPAKGGKTPVLDVAEAYDVAFLNVSCIAAARSVRTRLRRHRVMR